MRIGVAALAAVAIMACGSAAGTPKPVVERLAAWFNQITAGDAAKQFLARAAFDPFPGTPDSMAALMKTDAERWARYVRAAKIEPQ